MLKPNCNIFLLVSETMNHFNYFDTKNYFIDLRDMTLKYNIVGWLLQEIDSVRKIKIPGELKVTISSVVYFNINENRFYVKQKQITYCACGKNSILKTLHITFRFSSFYNLFSLLGLILVWFLKIFETYK